MAPHLFTTAMRRCFADSISLSTIGWSDNTLVSRADIDHHCEFDLNDSNFPKKWIDAGPFDVIVMGEILEHLFACPRLVMHFMTSLLATPGTLIIQTPNAAGLRNRLKLLMGFNHFEMIQPHRTGHVREYTLAEVCDLGHEVGLTVEHASFDDSHPERGILRLAEILVPAFRRRFTIVLRRMPQ